MKPIRIQRKRTRGWKMPENTVYVGRPSIWGNPFKIDERGAGPAMIKYKILISNDREMIEKAKRELKGKNLACWCKYGDYCHADVLLEIANS